ncbi:hypothetical protein AM501_10445 [Aneurinibacillus migulanus]|nr:hypothetical protein AM501_10445 [Aneurinibacillus migulanus]
MAGTIVEIAKAIPSSTVTHCRTMSSVLYEVKDEKIENNEISKEQKTKRRLVIVLADTFLSIKSTRDMMFLPPFIILFFYPYITPLFNNIKQIMVLFLKEENRREEVDELRKKS